MFRKSLQIITQSYKDIFFSLLSLLNPNSSPYTKASNRLATLLNDHGVAPSIGHINPNLLIVTHTGNLRLDRDLVSTIQLRDQHLLSYKN
jgi:hypothetical protein